MNVKLSKAFKVFLKIEKKKKIKTIHHNWKLFFFLSVVYISEVQTILNGWNSHGFISWKTRTSASSPSPMWISHTKTKSSAAQRDWSSPHLRTGELEAFTLSFYITHSMKRGMKYEIPRETIVGTKHSYIK